MHKLALRTLGLGLLKYNFCRPDVTIEQLVEHHIPALFMPHGECGLAMVAGYLVLIWTS